MKTSIVIPLGRGSKYNELELRFALRSISKHLTGYGDILIVGEYPPWLNGCIHIPATDGTQTYEKERNIFNKIMLACNDERISDDFLFMNDDHYLLRDYEAGAFPFYYDGRLSEKLTVTQFKQTVNNTMRAVLTRDPTYTDVHCPILYNKHLFRRLEQYDWSVKYGYCIKTLYCYESIHGMCYEHDLKIKDPLPYAEIIHQLKGRSWFSIGDGAFAGDIRQVLEDLYSVPSKHEKY
jgi:hypothetical protein